LTWPDRAWLALLAGTLPAGRLAAMRLIVTPGTIMRWQRDIVRRRWAGLTTTCQALRLPGTSVASAMMSSARGGREWAAVRTLMSEMAWVDYGQIYVESGEDYPDLAECFAGQCNGLCGAAKPGILFLITGLHSGQVGFTVELHDAPPPADQTWQEIVEASFRPIGQAALAGWGGMGRWPLRLAETSYRVRYCATGMDEANELNFRPEEDPEGDRYLLQFWPAPPEPDRVVKQTSEVAAYWHEYAREQPPPPSPEEKAAAERRARARREQAAEQARLEAERAEWGGRLPSQRLRDLGGTALNVAELDAPLVHALGDTDPDMQRKVARWVTRRVFAEAGLAEIDWIAEALDAMDRGDPLPWPFEGDDEYGRRAWDLLFSDERVPSTLVTSLDGAHSDLLQQAMAFPAVFSAREQDPLAAALIALWNAAVAFGHERYTVLFAEARQAFPPLVGD
jgi:hypothetical protein